MSARIMLAVTLLALGAMPVAGQHSAETREAAPRGGAGADATRPVVMPDAVAIEELRARPPRPRG